VLKNVLIRTRKKKVSHDQMIKTSRKQDLNVSMALIPKTIRLDIV
jgi:hypothetical protein